MEFGMVAVVGGIVLGWALERIKNDVLERRSEKERWQRLSLLTGRESDF